MLRIYTARSLLSACGSIPSLPHQCSAKNELTLQEEKISQSWGRWGKACATVRMAISQTFLHSRPMGLMLI